MHLITRGCVTITPAVTQETSLKAKPSIPALGALGERASALSAAVGEQWKPMLGLSMAPHALAQLQTEYLQQATQVWNQTLQRASGDDGEPALRDRRFAAQDWAAIDSDTRPIVLHEINRAITEMRERVNRNESIVKYCPMCRGRKNWFS